MDTEQPLHARPLLGFRDKMKELHPDAYISPRMGQWKPQCYQASVAWEGCRCVSWFMKETNGKDSPQSQEAASS